MKLLLINPNTTQAMTDAIAEAAQLSADLSDLYQHVAVIVTALLPVRHFFIALPEADGSRWQLCYQQNWPQDGQQNTAELPDLDALCLTVGQMSSPSQLAEGIGYGWLGLPLKDGNDLLGVLLLHPGEDVYYSAADLELLSYVTVQIAAAISRKTMLLRLQQPNALLLHAPLQPGLRHLGLQQGHTLCPLAHRVTKRQRERIKNQSFHAEASSKKRFFELANLATLQFLFSRLRSALLQHDEATANLQVQQDQTSPLTSQVLLLNRPTAANLQERLQRNPLHPIANPTSSSQKLTHHHSSRASALLQFY